ncbi:unnamed protein product [Nesidiocoris tenuis]|uniref:Uncharacterized protein n=1 Tax=Nesidiocoris tenuis TaxID=355587 RepID=A0A6H5FWG8_9HEMI|nr:unnamed protein product [Nesidiocoris tenuis]
MKGSPTATSMRSCLNQRGESCTATATAVRLSMYRYFHGRPPTSTNLTHKIKSGRLAFQLRRYFPKTASRLLENGQLQNLGSIDGHSYSRKLHPQQHLKHLQHQNFRTVFQAKECRGKTFRATAFSARRSGIFYKASIYRYSGFYDASIKLLFSRPHPGPGWHCHYSPGGAVVPLCEKHPPTTAGYELENPREKRVNGQLRLVSLSRLIPNIRRSEFSDPISSWTCRGKLHRRQWTPSYRTSFHFCTPLPVWQFITKLFGTDVPIIFYLTTRVKTSMPDMSLGISPFWIAISVWTEGRTKPSARTKQILSTRAISGRLELYQSQPYWRLRLTMSALAAERRN